MAYTKTTWVNGTTPINATNLNKIEDGIENASTTKPMLMCSLNTTNNNEIINISTTYTDVDLPLVKKLGVNDTNNLEVSSNKVYVRSSKIKHLKISCQSLINRGSANTTMYLSVKKNGTTIYNSRGQYKQDYDALVISITPIIIDVAENDYISWAFASATIGNVTLYKGSTSNFILIEAIDVE